MDAFKRRICVDHIPTLKDLTIWVCSFWETLFIWFSWQRCFLLQASLFSNSSTCQEPHIKTALYGRLKWCEKEMSLSHNLGIYSPLNSHWQISAGPFVFSVASKSEVFIRISARTNATVRFSVRCRIFDAHRLAQNCEFLPFLESSSKCPFGWIVLACYSRCRSAFFCGKF